MKLLVLAQTPPPLHGQSLMVQTAVDGLPQHGIEVHHVNLRLSRSHADIGGWRPGKILAVLDACFHAVVARFTEGCDTLYYVPAPAKRGALYRDWIVMALCRPFFRRLVLHFHNGGLGEWIKKKLTTPERALTRLLLGRADLAIVLTRSLRADADALDARTVAVVANGIALPAPVARRPVSPAEVLFLGLLSEEKGAPALARAVLTLRRRGQNVVAVLAGSLTPEAEVELASLRAQDPESFRYEGFVAPARKNELLSRCACLALPTRYAHEAQPLVVLEALAAGVPVVATAWRGIPETLPQGAATVPVGDHEALVAALEGVLARPIPPEPLRRHFELHFTRECHLSALATTLGNLRP